MTRKHFILLASVMRDMKPDVKDEEHFKTWASAVRKLSHLCKESNNLFNEVKFLDSCYGRR